MLSWAQTIKNDVFVDDSGVIRWGGTNKKVKGFEMNYTVPFAHRFRTVNRLGKDLKKAINNGIPVLVVDRKTDNHTYTAYLGADNIKVDGNLENILLH